MSNELVKALRGGTNIHFKDITAANSKTITVPAGHVYVLKNARGDITTTGTVGNRTPRFSITDGSTEVYHILEGNVAASTGKIFHYCPGGNFADTNNFIRPLPSDMALPAGWVIKFYDPAGIDATDTFRFMVEYDDIVVG